MKQIPITPEIIQLIKSRVSIDIDPDGFAVFEAIALNTLPLPGKKGSLHQDAVVMPVTLRQMADSIRNGNHLPLVSDHQLVAEPKGRVFDADLFYGEGGDLELRVLFYLDTTEQRLITKLNAGSLDEVSVSFLPTAFECSECGWDYMGLDATPENRWDKTCANGHTIGKDGVHANLIGLDTFLEVSLVARGAAHLPKIVGQSESKLQPAATMRLAARGFEDTSLFLVQASQGVTDVTDNTALITDLTNAKASVITLTASAVVAENAFTSLTADKATADALIVSLTSERDTAVTDLAAATAAADAAPAADYAAAVTFMQTTLAAVLVAAGKEPLAEMPTAIAELEASIRSETSDLTAILPVGGVANPATTGDKPEAPRLVASAYSNRDLSK
jgi:hypothetical protein